MHADGKSPFESKKWSQAGAREDKDQGAGLGSLVPGAEFLRRHPFPPPDSQPLSPRRAAAPHTQGPGFRPPLGHSPSTRLGVWSRQIPLRGGPSAAVLRAGRVFASTCCPYPR